MKKPKKNDTRTEQQRRVAQAARTKRRRATREKLSLVKAHKLIKQANKLVEENIRLTQEVARLTPAPTETGAADVSPQG